MNPLERFDYLKRLKIDVPFHAGYGVELWHQTDHASVQKTHKELVL